MNAPPEIVDEPSDDLRNKGLDWIVESLKTIADRSPIVLECATGAGNTTLRLARRMKGVGKVISVDIDEICWSEWALPKLRKESLEQIVTFKQFDLTKLGAADLQVDAIVCTTTLTTMGLGALDAICEWRKVLRHGGKAMIFDYLPQTAARNELEELTNRMYRLAKAIDVLCGEAHYEEMHPEFWQKRLVAEGFTGDSLSIDIRRPPMSDETFQEWMQSLIECPIHDAKLQRAIIDAMRQIRQEALVRGTLAQLSGTFLLLASLNKLD